MGFDLYENLENLADMTQSSNQYMDYYDKNRVLEIKRNYRALDESYD